MRSGQDETASGTAERAPESGAVRECAPARPLSSRPDGAGTARQWEANAGLPLAAAAGPC